MIPKPHPITTQKCTSLHGCVRLPGDKSISHRALILGALTIGRTYISGLLESADVLATANAMRALGADINRLDEGTYEVYGRGAGTLANPDTPLDFGNSGTGCRLVMGAVAGSDISAQFIGDASLSSRPMRRVIEPLAQMGAQITAHEDDRLPLTIRGAHPLIPLDYTAAIASAQVKSAILLAGLSTRGQVRIHEATPSRDHTERMLKLFNADITTKTDATNYSVYLNGARPLTPHDIEVAGDPSSGAFALIGALIVEDSEICLQNMLYNPQRIGLIETLREMGAAIDIENQREVSGEVVVDIKARASALKGVHVAAHRAASMIDEYPVLAIAAACACGESYFEGLGELRVKESDRLAAIAQGLASVGVGVSMGADWLRISGGGAINGGAIAAHDDHRIAMSFLILGLVSKASIIIDDARMIATSFPNFFTLMRHLGARFEGDEAHGAK